MALTIESALRKDRATAKHRKADGLQHRHFAFIAATLASLEPPFKMLPDGAGLNPHPDYMRWRDQVHYWADACAAGNPRFDRARFLRACGVTA